MEAKRSISDTTLTQSQWPRILFQAGFPLLAGLFLWKGISGMWDYAAVELSFQRQRVFGDWAPHLAKANTGLLFLSGLALAVSIYFRKLRLFALGLSAALVAGYTIYSQLVLLNALGNNCACIGWFSGMSWIWIVTMNACLLLLLIIAFLITLKEGRPT